MSKKSIDTTLIYEKLNKEKVVSYVESRDVTDNEKSILSNALSKDEDLFKTNRLGKNIVINKKIADKFIEKDKSMTTFRIVMYSILWVISIGLYIISIYLPFSQNRDVITLSDVIFAGLSFSLVVCMFCLFYGEMKNMKKIIKSQSHIDKSTSILNDEINVEIRTTSL
jgi:hypothetical protein